MVYSKEMLNYNNEKFKYDNIRYYFYGLLLDLFNLYNIIIMFFLIIFYVWV